jgi:hypothetical protein
MRAIKRFLIATAIAVTLSPMFPLLLHAGDNFRIGPP